MKVVYRAANVPEADIVTGMLKSRGIEATVGGRDLQTVVGAASIHDFARVLVLDEQYDEAATIVAEYEAKQPLTEEERKRRKPFTAMFVFSKPVLFWLCVFLLLYWFLFSGIP